ncbi:MAG: extracellular solute-binding protein [Firmicutes bacterium]|nr:extracellular solute-binding protein [Bacillota bacterium]
MVTLKMRRFFLFGVLVLSCVAVLCGVCAAKLVAINPGTHDGTTKAVAEFTKKTGIEVEVIATNWTAFDEKVPLMLAAGQQLDLIRFDQGHAALAALSGWIIPLTPLIERDKLNVNMWPKPVLWHAPYDLLGDVYTLPYNMAVSTTFYNRAHFRDAGVAYLTTEYGDPSMQIDAWVATLKKLQRVGADGKVDIWGTMISVGVEAYYLLGIFGVDWVTQRIDRFLGATPEVVAAYQRLVDVWLKDRVAPTPAERSGLALVNGNLATQVMQTGSWMVQIDPQQVDIGVAPLPWGTTVAVQGGINSWGISSTCKDVEAAWKFVKYFTYEEGYVPWLQYESLSPPVHRQYWRHWMETLRHGLPNADLTVPLEGANYYWNTRMSLLPNWTGSIKPVFERAVRKAAAGEAPVAAAMAEIEETMNSLIREQPLFK